MPQTLTMWAFALMIFSTCSTPVAHLVPLDLERREVCVENTIYLALQEFIYDADPWCRQELGIVDVSSTVTTVTGRMLVSSTHAEIVLKLGDSTTTFTKTTTSTRIETITVPSSTVTITNSPSFAVLPLGKRNPLPKIAAFQRLSFIQSINDGSASEDLYADVISACKCLHLEPRTDYVIASVSLARTIRAVDYRQTTKYITVTAGVVTEYKTAKNVTLIPTGLPVKSGSASLEITLPIEPLSSVSSSNLSLISPTAPSTVPTTLIGTGQSLSYLSTKVSPSNVVLKITVSPIPGLTSNLTRSLSIISITGTGLPSSVAILGILSSPSNDTNLVRPSTRTPTFGNSTAAVPTRAPPISLNTTYILPLPSRPTTSAPVNASNLVDLDLIIRDPRLPAICQSLIRSEISPVKTVLSTIVSTSVRTAVRTSVTTSVITSYITSIKTAIISKSIPTSVSLADIPTFSDA